MADIPSTTHNAKLCAEVVAKSKVFSRYPRVSDQAECMPLGLESLPPFAYNPSLLRSNGKLLMTYRYHFAGDFRTKVGIATIGDGGKVEQAQDLSIEGHSIEDARLFSFHAETWVSWVESNFLGQTDPKCAVKYGMLQNGKIERVYQPAQHLNDFKTMQKNWCFFESDENLFCVYESWPKNAIMHIQGETVVNEHKTDPVLWPYGAIRGGNIVFYDDKLLRFFHSSTEAGIGRPEKRYFVGAILMERRPPFTMLSVSSKPILYGSEVDSLKSADRKACRQHKQNVIFPCGAIADGDEWILACGINDAACALVRITHKMLNL